MKIEVKELIDRGKWDDICTAKRINPWAYNGGVLSGATIELTDQELMQFSIANTNPVKYERPDETCPEKQDGLLRL